MFNVNFDVIKRTLGSLIGESSGEDAIHMLMEDHKRVKRNFQQFQEAEDEEKRRLAAETMLELTLHSKAEEELVYPLIRTVDAALMNEAKVEHHLVDFLIAELQSMELSDPMFDAKFKVLGECVDHHVKEEESEAFPKLRQTGADLHELGEKIAARKHQLMSEYKDMKSFGKKASAKFSGIKTVGPAKSSANPKKAASRKPATKKASAKKVAPKKVGTKKAAAKGRSASKSSSSQKAKSKTTRKAATGKMAGSKPSMKSSKKRTGKMTKKAK